MNLKFLKYFTIVLLLIFPDKIFAYTYADAIKEVADAYYRNGLQVQYDTNRSTIFSPEDATVDDTYYMVCSNFVRNVYYNLIGINTGNTEELGNYASLMSKKDGRYNNDNLDIVLKYASCVGTKNEDSTYTGKKCSATHDYYGLNAVSTQYEKIKNSSASSYENFKKRYTNGQDVQIGDLIVYRWIKTNGDVLDGNITGISKGHVIMVYDLIKDSNGKIIDAVTLESKGGNLTKTGDSYEYLSFSSFVSDLYKKDSAYRNYDLSKYDFLDIEGGIHKDFLSNRYVNSILKASATKNKILQKVTVLRLFDTTTDINNSVKIKGFDDRNIPKISGASQYKNNYITRSLNNSVLTRLNNSGIDIEKTSSKHFSTVLKGDTVVYSVDIKNNSNGSYSGLSVVENISGGKIVSCNYNCVISGDSNQASWSNVSVASEKSIALKYSVKIGNGTELISSGKVGNISTATINNKVVERTSKDKISEYLKNKSAINLFLKKESGSANFVNSVYKYITGKNLFFNKNNKKMLVSDFIDKENKVINSSFNGYVTEYHSVYLFNTKNRGTEPRMKAPLYQNLNYGDVIIYNRNSANVYFMFLDDKLIYYSKGYIYVYTSKGKYKFDSYIDLTMASKDIDSKYSKSKISNYTLEKFMRNTVSTDSYVIISPEFI